MSYGIVYLVTNRVNGKRYVGQTTKRLTTRWKNHIRGAFRQRYGWPLPSAIRKYGPDAFTVVEICSCRD